MPEYTYRCDNCGHEFDKKQSFSEDALKKCPVCKKLALNKVYKPARVVFKGSGYYVTDNKSRQRPSQNGSSAGENGEKGSGKEKKSGDKEAKPSGEAKAKKSEAKSKESSKSKPAEKSS